MLYGFVVSVYVVNFCDIVSGLNGVCGVFCIVIIGYDYVIGFGCLMVVNLV